MSTILVVDDDVDLREALCDALDQAGHVVVSAREGREALRMLRADPSIELVLLDLMMPVMSGWEFRVAQLADPAIAAVPVVVMTAAADLTRSPIDAAKILKKPLTVAQILDAVRSYALPKSAGADVP